MSRWPTPQPIVMAQVVTMPGSGILQAGINPDLPLKQQVLLACQCSMLFAKEAARLVAEGDVVEDKPRILVPNLGVRL